MKDTEFNKVKISNEKDGFASFEYGKIQNTEYYFKDDNKNKIKDEVNDNVNTNYDIASSSKKESKKLENSNKDNTNNTKELLKANQSTLTTTATTTSAIAGTSASVVATASVVAATGIVATAVGAGILINAKCKINSIITTPISVDYNLDLEDVKNDSVIINLENNEQNFKETKNLQEGNNIGYFNNLTPSCKYTLSVIDQTHDNYVIFNQEVSTLSRDSISANINSEVKHGIEYFSINLNYDEKNLTLTDFKLHLFNSINIEKVYPLEKTKNSQQIKLNNTNDNILFDFDDEKGFDYYISYVSYNENLTTIKNHIVFNVVGKVTSIDNFKILYSKSNNQKLGISYDYVDDYKKYSDPKIEFVNFLDYTDEKIINIDLKTGFQEVDAKDLDFTSYYRYKVSFLNLQNSEREIIFSGIIGLAEIEHNYIEEHNPFIIHPEYFLINNIPYMNIEINMNDYENEYGNLYFVYKEQGTSSQEKECKLNKKSGNQFIPLSFNSLNDEIILESIKFEFRKNGNKNVHSSDSNIHITKNTNPEIFGGVLANNEISISNPYLDFYIYHNDYETNQIENVAINFYDTTNPTFETITYSINITSLNTTSNKLKLDLTSHSNYSKLLEYLKDNIICISITYNVLGDESEKFVILYEPTILSIHK